MTDVSKNNNTASGQDARNRRYAALKLTEDGRPATLAELGDDRATLNRNERIKVAAGGFSVWQRIVEVYSKQGFASIAEDDFERFKWIGIYQQRPKDGHFMMRLKVPGGALNTNQLRVCAEVASKYARGILDITTRQDFQMHWLTIEDVPDVVERLTSVGLTTMGACGDICRNVTASPLAGIDPEELIDPLPLVNAATALFAENEAYADLPRKHKITILGNRASGMAEINEIGLYGVKRSDDGSVGYHCLVGGGLSTEPHFGQNLGVFIEPGQALEVLEAITKLYRDHGYRKNRKHSRLKYLVADWGAAKVRTRTEEYLGYRLRDADLNEPVSQGYGDRYGIHPQKQDGLNYIGVPVVAGRITTEQASELANIAEECGSGDIRLTVGQSLYIINVPDKSTAQVASRLAAVGLPIDLGPVHRGIISCTGIEFCNLAVTETKARARQMAAELESRLHWKESPLFRINVNGCPNSCGQHWIADVGLQGCTKKVDGQLVEHYDVCLGGTLGTNATFTRRIKRVSAEEVVSTVEALVASFRRLRVGDETFTEFCNRHTEEQLEQLI